MNKGYLAKIIARDSQGLKLISACCFQAKVNIGELKYLKKNQIFLIFLQRFNRENKKNKEKINSVCKFEFVEYVKSKNIDQKDKDLILELFAIDLIKNKNKFEINLIFNNNSFITLSTEIVEVTLEDQNKI
ncbi:MAG TPA: DUF2948 family protein [Candidatus Pelagibacter bacterium]|jgi:hypothetical protein|nr:hypothetical protein [Pelagibacteraceae bacterium]HJN83924.1 DUF2948 family protein [Candidatus Pelagibacter bacterium]|tara:strand:+ start:694 stop:1086 length:393 start_codon:yes stop_codon:yes gene_type:complete